MCKLCSKEKKTQTEITDAIIVFVLILCFKKAFERAQDKASIEFVTILDESYRIDRFWLFDGHFRPKC